MWSRLLDRVHMVHFRAYHSWTFGVANALMGVGFLADNMPMLILSRVVLGVTGASGACYAERALQLLAQEVGSDPRLEVHWLASANAARTTGTMARRCSRLASSGTTPP